MKISLLSLVVAAGFCSLSSAAILVPGNAQVPPDTFSPLTTATLLATTGPQALSSGSFTGTGTAWVYSDPTNIFCANCLDFVYQVTDNGPQVNERISAAVFTGFSTDAGYVTGGSGKVPNSVDRSTDGSVVAFYYPGANNLLPGQTTALLVVKTNATSFITGTFSVQDGLSANAVGYSPTSVPEPVSMCMFGGSLALLGLARLRRTAKNK
jgi:hypothetical protein